MMVFGLTGCQNKDYGDCYIEGSDYQCMLQGRNEFSQKEARGSEGYFFLRGNHILFLDDNKQTLVPLCNKADCLHNEEIDENRYKECNAYVSNIAYDALRGISYCNGYLYYLVKEFDADGQHQILYRMKEDGSEKQILYKWEEWSVEQWCIHRDTLYFVEHTYEVVKNGENQNETVENYAVKKLNLVGLKSKKPETIYKVADELTVYSIGGVKAYGEHIYFKIHAATLSDTTLITDENYLDYTYFKELTYDIKTGECKELELPEAKKGVYINTITFWNGKLILKEYDFNQELDGKANSWLADLDGSNVEVFETDKIQGEAYISDGKYLYVSNSPLVIRGYDNKQIYRVYDENMNLVDTLAMPFSSAVDPAIGMEEGQYIFIENEDYTGAQLYFFDKETIGTYQGEKYKISLIADWKNPPEELTTIRFMQGLE